jgi:hypothetical protein
LVDCIFLFLEAIMKLHTVRKIGFKPLVFGLAFTILAAQTTGAETPKTQSASFNGQKLMPIPGGVPQPWGIDCFWGEPISYGGKAFRAMGYANGQMVNFMDIEASYWPARFKLAPGEKLTLTGYFPHARYASFNSYGGGAPTSSLVDKDIQPDAGSTNPFLQGAKRNTPTEQRKFTMTVINEVAPANPADRVPNTLYARPAAAPFDIVELRYRTYLVDETPQNQFDQRGGVPLPLAKELVQIDGARLPGAAMCSAPRAMAQKLFVRTIPPDLVTSWWQSMPCTSDTPRGQFCNDPFTAPAQNPPTSEKFFGIPYSIKGLYLPPDQRAKLKPPPANLLAKGFEGNLDNGYLSTYLNNHFGKVVLMRAKYPRTPRTYFDNEAWDERNTEMRYWSVMSGNELSSTQIAAGLVDEQVPINSDGYFNVVVSKPEDRPRFATQECGYAWLDWGRRGDFTGRDGQTVLVWRHTLPSEGFRQSILAVADGGTERDVMGAYLPVGQYFKDAAAFDAAASCNKK